MIKINLYLSITLIPLTRLNFLSNDARYSIPNNLIATILDASMKLNFKFFQKHSLLFDAVHPL